MRNERRGTRNEERGTREEHPSSLVPRPSSLKWTVSVLVAIAAAGGGWLYYQHHRYKHFAVHQAGMIYRSAWLEPDVIRELIERYQIRTVVNLCRPGEMGEQRWIDERNAVEDSGARLLELPMPDTLDPADAQIATDIKALSDPKNYPMLVHCQHGVTRTDKFLAVYDIVFRGLSAKRSLEAMPLFGRDQHNVHVRAFARNLEKECQRHPRAAAADRLSVLSR